MLFPASISMKSLSLLCRTLGTMLHSGIAVHKAFDMASRKVGDSRCRAVLGEVTREILQGSDVSTALRDQPGYFPELFVDLVDVSEQSGAMPEVLKALGEHYDNMLRLRKAFLGQIAMPVFQLLFAIVIVAGLILILGLIGEAKGNGANDMLGWGLSGPSGAITFLSITLGSLAAIFAAYYVVAFTFQKQRILDGLLLRIPVVGGCLRSFAIARFAWAYSLTAETGMPVRKALAASFRATGNGAFRGASDLVCQLIQQGEDLSSALRAADVFPEEFLQIVEVAESSGTVPESLARLSPEFEEQARRSLKTLAEVFGWLIWAMVAGLIIFVIFSVFSSYVGMINEAGGF
jgi:type IV pilus assembly protein PilC